MARGEAKRDAEGRRLGEGIGEGEGKERRIPELDDAFAADALTLYKVQINASDKANYTKEVKEMY